jgi:hypothetical protein
LEHRAGAPAATSRSSSSTRVRYGDHRDLLPLPVPPIVPEASTFASRTMVSSRLVDPVYLCCIWYPLLCSRPTPCPPCTILFRSSPACLGFLQRTLYRILLAPPAHEYASSFGCRRHCLGRMPRQPAQPSLFDLLHLAQARAATSPICIWKSSCLPASAHCVHSSSILHAPAS